MLINILAIIVAGGGLVYRFGPAYLLKRQTKDATDWPETEATIRSAGMELIERIGHIREEVPFFAFSYVVESEYYSGRFGLRVPEDRAPSLMREWIDTKIVLQYDPSQPSVFRLPDELPVDGFRRGTVPETDLSSHHSI
jgi:hypothetical protein